MSSYLLKNRESRSRCLRPPMDVRTTMKSNEHKCLNSDEQLAHLPSRLRTFTNRPSDYFLLTGRGGIQSPATRTTDLRQLPNYRQEPRQHPILPFYTVFPH